MWATWDSRIQSALIGAVVTLIGIFFRDFVFKRLESKRVEQRTAQFVFRKYADPLALAAESLLWRLNETLRVPGRAGYLLPEAHQTEFAKYKRISTVYRIAALLGWIQALRRELLFLRASNESNLAVIGKSLTTLEETLADGQHVEAYRLDRLLALWKLTEKAVPQKRPLVEIAVTTILQDTLHNHQVALAQQLEPEAQQKLCQHLAQAVAEGLDVPHPSRDLIERTQAEVIDRFSCREAWVYRDWQTGIGDLMIRKTDGGERRFEVMGFRDFEDLILADKVSDKRHLGRIQAMLDGLNVNDVDDDDFRYPQLLGVLHATAHLLRVLTHEQPELRPLFVDALALVDDILTP